MTNPIDTDTFEQKVRSLADALRDMSADANDAGYEEGLAFAADSLDAILEKRDVLEDLDFDQDDSYWLGLMDDMYEDEEFEEEDYV